MKRVLMIIGGPAHPFEACARIFKSAMEASDRFEVTVTSDRASLTNLVGVDAVVMYTVEGEMTGAQEQGLVNFVRSGGGLLAIHCANANMEQFSAYTEMVGSAFTTHGPLAPFSVELTADAGDILPRTSGSFTVTDEFYFIEPRTDAPLREFMHGTWQFQRHPLGYVRDYGEGRVLYTALGHDERTFRHPAFQGLTLKGLRYVTRQEKEGSIRIGLLGYGPAYQMGKHHSEQIAATQGLELTAVCDRDPARLDAAKQEQGGHISTFTDAAEMAASGEIDLGVVILPHALHEWGIRTLLDAGLHAITEKPFAVTVKQCDTVISLAREKGLMLSIYHNRHWDPDVVTLREIVEAGTIGDLYSMECNMVGYGRPGQAWRSHKPISGGALYDMGAHQFEKVLQLLPKTDRAGNPINRSASLYGHFLKKVWHDVTNEDHIRAYARFDGGIEAQVLVSSICSASKPLWTVLGTQGSAVVEGFAGGATVTTVDDAGRRFTSEYPQPERDRWAYYKNIADHLLTGAPLIITPEWAKGTIQCIEGCETAAREDRVVEVTFDF